MPRVAQSSGGGTVRLNPLPGARQTGRQNAGTAAAYGGAIGDSLSQIGEGLYRDVQAIKLTEQRQQDAIRVQTAEAQVSDWELKTIYDPKTGALSKTGVNAFNLPDEVSASYDQTIGDIRNGLSSDAQRAAFDRAIANRKPSILGRVNTHVLGQMNAVGQESYRSYIGNSRALAQQNAGDPARVATEIENQREHTVVEAGRLGLDAETTKRMVSSVTSDTHVAVLDQLLATENDVGAKDYFSQVKGEIEGPALPQVEKALNVGRTRGESQRQFDAIMLQAATEQEAIEKAREIKDPEIRDSVEDRVQSEWRLRKQRDREAKEETIRTHAEAIDKIMLDAGNRIDAVGTIQKAISPAAWAQLMPNEKVALENYAKRKQGGGEVETDWNAYYSLRLLAENPATRNDFADPSKTNLMLYIAKLGKTEFKELVGLQGAIRQKDTTKTEELLSHDGLQSRMVTDAMLSIGLDPTALDNPSAKGYDKIAVDRGVAFRRSVRENVAGLEARQGKKATDEQVQEIVDNLIVKADVVIPGSLWGTKLQEKFLFEAGPKDTLIITADDVPKSERAIAIAVLKKLGRTFWTDEDILAVYMLKLQKLGVNGVKKRN